MAVTYTVNAGVTIRDYRGLSIDRKPIEGVPNGSTFYEMDTDNLFMFDGENKVWLRIGGA